MKEKSNLTLFMEQLYPVAKKKKSVSVPPTSTKAH